MTRWGTGSDGSAVIDPGSRLRSQDRPGATVSYDYDAVGNVIRREIDLASGTDTAQDLYWGALGQLDSVKVSEWSNGQWDAVNTIRYRYDGFGQKIAQLSDTDTVKYAWASGHVLFEVRNGTTTQFAYLPGRDRPHSMLRNDTTYYYLTDHLGSVVAVADSTGGLRARYEYDAWGEREVLYDNIGQSCGFTGREYDPETGYYYMRARFYDARTGRFLSEDPAGLASGLNAYSYAANNPLTFRDPSGLQEEDEHGEPASEWEAPPGCIERSCFRHGEDGEQHDCWCSKYDFGSIGMLGPPSRGGLGITSGRGGKGPGSAVKQRTETFAGFSGCITASGKAIASTAVDAVGAKALRGTFRLLNSRTVKRFAIGLAKANAPFQTPGSIGSAMAAANAWRAAGLGDFGLHAITWLGRKAILEGADEFPIIGSGVLVGKAINQCLADAGYGTLDQVLGL